ncbi:hypothetical protein EDD21DRAFT_82509 [Dissophora ornata]|nr:hypothetical protein EDD21DRAFT_82509 [Dissophora ornata]
MCISLTLPRTFLICTFFCSRSLPLDLPMISKHQNDDWNLLRCAALNKSFFIIDRKLSIKYEGDRFVGGVWVELEAHLDIFCSWKSINQRET